MNKFLSLITAAGVAITLAGCDQKSTADETNPTPPSRVQTAEKVAEQVSAENQAKPVASKVKITHASGDTMVNIDPKNTVLFDFGSMDTLNALGVKFAAFPKGNTPAYLSQYDTDAFKNAGGMKEPDIEAIKSVHPELIVITGRQGKSYAELSALAPTINLTIDNKNYLSSFKNNVQILGKIFNKQAEAEAAIASLDAKISSVRDKATHSDKKALVLVHVNGKMNASNTNGYAAIIFDVLGVKKADEALGDARQEATGEYIAEKNPDIIFIVDRNEAIKSGKLDRDVIETEQLKSTNAYKQGKVIYLTPDLWYLSGGGLQSLNLQIDEVAAALAN